jgi:3-hydroxyisobutyrate dehydrogenase
MTRKGIVRSLRFLLPKNALKSRIICMGVVMAKVAFIGLGVMGFPMAGHLVAKGHAVTVYNRNPARAAAWAQKYGAKTAPTPKAACGGVDLAFLCVGDDADVRNVIMGDQGMLAGVAAGAVIIDHTTASADVAREMQKICAAKGVGFVDAPVSGGQAGAENGQLTIMCGGSVADYAKAEPVMTGYAKACKRMGDSGAGQLTKMINQICIAGAVQGLAEGLAFGLKAGLNMDDVVAVISAKTMCEGNFDFGFATNWMRKDLRLCLDEARRNGARLPVAALVDQFYAAVQKNGGGRWDTSSLMSLLKD